MSSESYYDSIGKVITILVGIVLRTLAAGFVLMKLWGWFVVPLFHTITLSIIPAIGLMMTARFVTVDVTTSRLDKDVSWSKLFVESIFFLAFVLAFGYIIHYFV